MRYLLPLLIVLSIAGLHACNKPVETTENIPARLSISWSEPVNPANANQLRHDLDPQRRAELTKISPFKLESTLHFSPNKGETIDFIVRFEKEIKFEDKEKIMPQLKTIFQEQTFNANFQAATWKKVIEERTGIFLQNKRQATFLGPPKTIEIPSK
ncbi:hypothetical protein RF679_13625 [Undibacterium cyanobacteriorum]|uniref:Lipoprotein n=1 Tax=Undibacterium cyanobacteriorum TaxID=3073561 RepID=A0ABY9REN3_9BURK|nr:hypothetical protein [Undibacterium sp. 20NA77.5]WMW79685.1 hypothetical protein RF679_13625 [Undibacterium sp. 20NA77.5]